MAFRLLKCLARAIAKHSGKLAGKLAPWAEVLYEIAADVYQDYRQDQQHDDLRAEVQALAQAPPADVGRAVADAVRQEAGQLPAAEQQKLAAYLGQVPAMVRRSLRRPSDPTGTTVPPSFALRGPEDLLHFLPPRPPRFSRGDRPLPGVDWILEEPLGVGGFGEVWKARHAHLQSKQPVALKFCLDTAAVPVLRNEAGILDRVMQHGRHPGIVPLLNTYLSANPPCLEYEYVEGGDLTALIQELHGGGKMKPLGATHLLLRLTEIVAFAHQASPPIVHGDLKPANILVRHDADGKLALRVTDFGIGGLAVARAVRETRQPTRSRHELVTEAVRGAYTPVYASLEQMKRRPGEPTDPRDDVHALGVIWNQLVTSDMEMLSVPPDWKEQLEQRGLAAGLITLLGTCISRKAEVRPASAVALARQLRAALREGEGPPERKPRPFPWVAVAACTAILLAVVLFVLVSASGHKKDEPFAAKKPSLDKKRVDKWEQPFNKDWEQPFNKDKVPFVDKGGFPNKADPGPKAGDVVTNTLGMKLVLIRAGDFTMGSSADGYHEHPVRIIRPFYLGKYEVTKGEFAKFVDDTGYQTDAEKDGKGGYGWDANGNYNQKPEYTWRNPGWVQTDRHPVVNVSWNDAKAFCDWLSAKEGKKYRLPTEAEWEYSCRAGTRTHYHSGDDDESLVNVANIADAAAKRKFPNWTTIQADDGYVYTAPVGQFKANDFGLHDMHGNAWEWCQDWYSSDYYKSSPTEDPQGPSAGATRVFRGGSFNLGPRFCRSACRGWHAPSYRYGDLGFRVVWVR